MAVYFIGINMLAPFKQNAALVDRGSALVRIVVSVGVEVVADGLY